MEPQNHWGGTLKGRFTEASTQVGVGISSHSSWSKEGCRKRVPQSSALCSIIPLRELWFSNRRSTCTRLTCNWICRLSRNELILHERNGLLARGTVRSTALAEALARVMGSESLRRRLATQAADSVAQHSLEQVIEKWEELILRVSQGRATLLNSSRVGARSPSC